MEEKYDSREDTLKHIAKVAQYMEESSSKLIERSKVHDKSKLEEPEKSMFDGAISKLKEIEYGTKEYDEALKELAPALKHHYENNSHHPEFYSSGINGMSLFDLTEMMMDWKAATERMKDDGDIRKSLDFNKKRFNITDQTYNILLNTINEMGW